MRRVFVRELVGVGVSPGVQQDRRQFLIGEVVSLVQENRVPGSSVKASFTAFEFDGSRYIAPATDFFAATELFSDGEPLPLNPGQPR